MGFRCKSSFADGPLAREDAGIGIARARNRNGAKRLRRTRRKHMKASTEDKIKGSFHEVKGKVKEKAGQAANNPNLEDKGSAENFAGKVQKKVGQIEEVFEK
jgi:uncharacterized protein YjbJ (UPF0337 family)